MHVDRIPNRTSPPAFLLRETYREGSKVKKRTLANITQWPVAKIEALRRLLRDEYAPHEPRADVLLPFRRVSPPAVRGVFGSVALSIPLGLMFGRPGPPLRRVISSRCAATVRRSSATSSNSFSTKLFKSPGEKSSRSAGGTIPTRNLTRASLGIL
jgi:hypothetical protein